ncbi:hypothetical protein [Aquimarina litoralis]|uniref:hypothetical protein n=1 Tax=Aquimarina litoralis TaxID=584605 RepID=UPI001C5887D2|nr:hypothetical protein [Aquimarina litoralis]MBW1298186.1 hypothetical protein [Aquimarina litoralis]
MKFQNNVLGKLSKVILVLSVLFMSSCGNDDDGTPVDAFVTLPSSLVTTFDGELTYTPANGMGIVAGVDGTATISGSGNTYTISFSDGVPSITGLRFIGSGNGSYATVGTDGSAAGITIENDELTIGATISGNAWAFTPN